MARNIPFRVVGRCIDCAQKIEGYRHSETLRCERCHDEMCRVRSAALITVRRAVASGDLRHASDLTCLDCEEPAEVYDHRNYREPLVVVPVCRKCNQRRGPAVWREYAGAA